MTGITKDQSKSKKERKSEKKRNGKEHLFSTVSGG
jgi:hypothetical protein